MNILYKITNQINRKFFIGYYTGKDKNIKTISPGNKEITNDIKEFGKENFEYTILGFFLEKEELKKEYKKIINKDLLLSPLSYNNKCLNRLTVKDKFGKTRSILNTDPKYLNGEFVPITRGKIVVKNEEGKFVSIKKEHYYNNKEKFINNFQNQINFKKRTKKPSKIIIKKENGYLSNLKKEFPSLNISFLDNQKYKIDEYCLHNTEIIINRGELRKRLKNPHWNGLICYECLIEKIEKKLITYDKQYYIDILSELKLNQLNKNYLVNNFPILYYLLDRSYKEKSLKERIYLFKNNIDELPKCIIDGCQNYTNFSISINKYNTYCSCHSYYSSLSSSEEKLIYEWLSSLYNGTIIRNYRGLNNRELDIYIPDKKLAIEYNGLYWHSDSFKSKLYHYNKWKLCHDNGIRLITIWEDIWRDKKEQIKYLIIDGLGQITDLVSLEECFIKEIEDYDYRKFVEENYLEEYEFANIKIGLYYKNNLISVISFNKSINDQYKLLAFSNKLGNRCLLFSRLLDYFIQKYRPSSIKANMNLDLCDESIFINKGFIKYGKIMDNYWWSKNGKRHNFKNKGFDKNYGAGKQEIKYELCKI